jgi:DNA adenine methylase
MSEELDLTKILRVELLEKCEDLGIKKYKSKNKKQLIDLINGETNKAKDEFSQTPYCTDELKTSSTNYKTNLDKEAKEELNNKKLIAENKGVNIDMQVMDIINNKSPLRYPGGKTRACKKLETIMKEHFNICDFDNLISPFFGGGSFEFHIQNKYQLNIVANDKFIPLYNFWNICKNNKENLCAELSKKIDMVDKDYFYSLREQIMKEKNKLNQSIMYFIINRCSFSGATLSGGFSLESSKKRFTKSSIERINKLNLKKFNIHSLDFEDFIETNQDTKNLVFLDPPYYLEKSSTLYGNNGDMHDTFDHNKLYKCLSTKKNWFMTYNNCEYIKNLYKDFKTIETSWSYGMNKSKKSSEIVIIG